MTDIHPSLRIHPGTGDFILNRGRAAVLQSMKNLILLSERDILHSLNISVGSIFDLLFSVSNPVEFLPIRNKLIDLLNRYEERIDVQDVRYELLENEIKLIISYTYQNDELLEDQVIVRRNN